MEIRFAELKQKDEMIKYVVNMQDFFRKTAMDNIVQDKLRLIGGQLIAAFAYLQTKAVELEAEHRNAELNYRIAKGELYYDYRKDANMVTDARYQSEVALADNEREVISIKTLAKYYEVMANVSDKMISFIQSAIKSLQSEQIHNRAQIAP